MGMGTGMLHTPGRTRSTGGSGAVAIEGAWHECQGPVGITPGALPQSWTVTSAGDRDGALQANRFRMGQESVRAKTTTLSYPVGRMGWWVRVACPSRRYRR